MPTLLKLEDSLEQVRLGLENRARRISGRVGRELADVIGRPGKMLRARFCLLLGAALGADAEKTRSAARAMEWVHTASLLHDDCVDDAEMRRGYPTPNKIFGTTTGLLLGDLAFSQGLEEAIEVSPSAVRHLVTTVREMTVGELQEEFLRGNAAVTMEGYMGVASRKTGALFEWCGNVLSELSQHPHEKADPPRLACAAGILLQIVDDIHDYTLTEEVSGKDAAKDFMLGRLTLPGVLAVEKPQTRERFVELWKSSAKDAAGAKDLREFLESEGFLEGAREVGRELVRSMLAMVRQLPLKEEAQDMADFVEVMAKREF
ncbi:MAG: polyprenyl synthetase family protein [Elusimicrobia bacterium]|nr:polyprenyl synthetase family protein [Elusimicrobiota bacterium]